MVVVRLMGGLGNQMFQYAFASTIASDYVSKVYLDKSWFEEPLSDTVRKFELSIFPNKYNEANENQVHSFKKVSIVESVKQRLNLPYKKTYYEPAFGFSEVVAQLKPPVYLEGYFQSAVYFERHSRMIRELFHFKENLLSTESLAIKNQLAATITVSVHFRRGDYLKNEQVLKFHGICSKEYYDLAIDKIKIAIPDATFVFFADDHVAVEKYLQGKNINCRVVSHNSNDDSWQDMYLMSQCNHHIIANSSFSWWGAWLNPNEEKMVIGPSKWFADETANAGMSTLFPAKWVKI